MNKEAEVVVTGRARHLIRLARALYESATEESDKERLELHRKVAVAFAALADEASEEDNTLHPDLGLELLLFIELKQDGNSAAETDRKVVQVILEELEKEYGIKI